MGRPRKGITLLRKKVRLVGFVEGEYGERTRQKNEGSGQ